MERSVGVSGASPGGRSFELYLRFADDTTFVGVTPSLEGESSSLFTSLFTGDLPRRPLPSLTGDLFRTGERLSPLNLSDFDVFLACALLRGVGLMVSAAKAMSIPSFAVMSSPAFTLQEIEQ